MVNSAYTLEKHNLLLRIYACGKTRSGLAPDKESTFPVGRGNQLPFQVWKQMKEKGKRGTTPRLYLDNKL